MRQLPWILYKSMHYRTPLTGFLLRNVVEGLHVEDSVDLEAHVVFWIHAAGDLLRFGLGEGEGDAGPEQPFAS